MKCPVCNVPLMPSDRQEVPIDFCPRCWGIWLDRGELDQIISRTSADLKRHLAGDPPVAIPTSFPRFPAQS